jgi:hypothetical protein
MLLGTLKKEEDMRQVAAFAGYGGKHRGLLHEPGDSITRPLCHCHGSSHDLVRVTEIALCYASSSDDTYIPLRQIWHGANSRSVPQQCVVKNSQCW